MADSGAKYCAVANKFGLNDEYQKDVLNPLLKKEMCVCVSELALERVCAIRGSVRLWKGKLHCARPFCHGSHGIPAVMLRKSRVDDQC